MAKESEKNYEKVIRYVEDQILSGVLQVGDRLPPERTLSQMLGLSRGSVREGMNVMEAIGLVSNQHGSGNYISDHFDETLARLMTMMYTLDRMSYEDICSFRRIAETQAVTLACSNSTNAQKKQLQASLQTLEESTDAEQQTQSDKMIHYTLVEASGNRLLLANYLALTRVMDTFIRDVRTRVQEQSDRAYHDFQETHRRLVEAVCAGDQAQALKALQDHFAYLES